MGGLVERSQSMATFRSRSRSRKSGGAAGVRRHPGSPLPRAQPRPFYAAIEDMRRGKVASNEELKSWLGYLNRSLAVPSGKLSPSGRSLVGHLSELFRLLESVLDERNQDQLLQRFFTHARLAGMLAVQEMGRSGRLAIVKEPRRQVYLFGSKEPEAKEHAAKLRKEALKEVRALYRMAQFMIASPEVRSTMTQAQSILRRIVQSPQSTGQVPTSKSVRFAQAEQQPEYKQQQTVRSSLSTSELDRSIQKLREQIQETGQDIGRLEGERPLPTYQAYSGIVEGFIQQQQPQLAEYQQQQRKQEYYQETFSEEARQSKKVTSDEPAIRRIPTPKQQESSELLPQISQEEAQRLPIFTEEEEQQQQQQQERGEEKVFSREVEQPEQVVPMMADDRKQLIRDMKELFRSVSTQKDLRKTVRDAMTYAQSLQSLGVQAVQEPTGPIPEELRYEENIKAAQRDLLKLLERFAGGATLSPLLGLIEGLRNQMATDYELKDFLGDWMAFIRRCLKDPAYLESQEYEHRADFLLDRTATISQSKYGDQFRQANQLFNSFLEGWRNDKLTGKIGTVLNSIVKEDLAGGGAGSTSTGLLVGLMRPDLLHDFRHVLLPSMLANLHEIPLPRIESISDGNRLVLENVVIPSGGFLPGDLDVRQSASLRMNPREKILGTSSLVREKGAKYRSGWNNALRIRLYVFMC